MASPNSIEDNSQTTTDTPPGNIIQRMFKQLWYLVFSGMVFAMVDFIKDIFIKAPAIDFEKLEKRSDQTAIVTGGPRGIGFDIIKKLLQLDYTVIIGVRNIPAGEKGIEEIRKLGITCGQVKLLKLDLKSLRSVRHFATEILKSKEGARIDLLMNNAGILNVPYEITEDNFESQFQVNYLSHFLLTNLLLPRMKETSARKNEPCQIVNTSSHAQQGGRIDFDELEVSKVYSPIKCYFDSKLCQVLHVKSLEQKFQEEEVNMHAYTVHPGEIPTDIWSELGFLVQLLRPIVKSICRTTDEAANTVLYPVLNSEVGEKHGGEYFQNGKVIIPNPQANNKEIQRRLWERSIQLTQ